MNSGQQFVKMLRPLGCVLFLLMAVGVTLICFTAGRDPIPGYAAPEDTAYYAEHLDALQQELETSVFPQLQGVVGSEITGDQLTVQIDGESFAVTRSAILRYFDESLFLFVSVD
jgi:hypothetical protein